MSFNLESIFLALNTIMHWTYQGKEITSIPEDIIGFVYLITNTTNGRKYIGKKLARFRRSRPPLKGNRNRRRYKVDSDWQDYYGSSDDLTIDVNFQALEALKSLTQAALQNDKMSISDVISVYNSSSIADIKNKIKASEAESQQREQQLQQQQMQIQQEI